MYHKCIQSETHIDVCNVAIVYLDHQDFNHAYVEKLSDQTPDSVLKLFMIWAYVGRVRVRVGLGLGLGFKGREPKC